MPPALTTQVYSSNTKLSTPQNKILIKTNHMYNHLLTKQYFLITHIKNTPHANRWYHREKVCPSSMKINNLQKIHGKEAANAHRKPNSL